MPPELEGEFAELNGWEAETDAGHGCWRGLGVEGVSSLDTNGWLALRAQ